MIIGIIIGIIVVFGIISVLGGVLKKVLEVISGIAKFIICGAVAMLLVQSLSIEVNGWGSLLVFLIGGIIIFALLFVLASKFRLVSYAINYLVDSIIVAFVVQIFAGGHLDFIPYVLILFLFPRIMWISDRFSTTSTYSHTEYSFFSNVATEVYSVEDMDWWGNSADAWNQIPLQIVISCIFYMFGNCMSLSAFPVDSDWLSFLYLVLATAINVVFDLFIFRGIDEAIDS